MSIFDQLNTHSKTLGQILDAIKSQQIIENQILDAVSRKARNQELSELHSSLIKAANIVNQYESRIKEIFKDLQSLKPQVVKEDTLTKKLYMAVVESLTQANKLLSGQNNSVIKATTLIQDYQNGKIDVTKLQQTQTSSNFHQKAPVKQTSPTVQPTQPNVRR